MNVSHYPRLDETVSRRTLANGLQIAVVNRPGFSKRLAYFAADFGSVHTDFTFEGKRHTVPAGIAHYLEHKLFDMPDGRDVSAEFAGLGALTNAFTSFDITAYYFSCTENFEQCLRLLLEFVSTPYFTEESVEKERGIIDQEIGMNVDSPDSRVFEELMQAAFANHPIRVPILGSRESIRQITPENLYLVHRAFYAPGNMMLCVVGDVDGDRVAEIAEEILGTDPKEVAMKQNSWQEPAHCPESYVMCRMEVAMPMFNLCFKVGSTPHGEEGIRRELVADLAAEALFGESSRLYLRLYEDGIIDSSFGGGFETIDGCAMLLCSGDSEAPETLRDALLEEAERIVREGVSEEDFLRMKRSALGRRIRELDSFDSICFRTIAYQMTLYDYFRFPEVYARLQKEEIQDFLRQTVRRDNCCLSVINPVEE